MYSRRRVYKFWHLYWGGWDEYQLDVSRFQSEQFDIANADINAELLFGKKLRADLRMSTPIDHYKVSCHKATDQKKAALVCVRFRGVKVSEIDVSTHNGLFVRGSDSNAVTWAGRLFTSKLKLEGHGDTERRCVIWQCGEYGTMWIESEENKMPPIREGIYDHGIPSNSRVNYETLATENVGGGRVSNEEEIMSEIAPEAADESCIQIDTSNDRWEDLCLERDLRIFENMLNSARIYSNEGRYSMMVDKL